MASVTIRASSDSRVEQINLFLPPPDESWQNLTPSVSIPLHRTRCAGKVVVIKIDGNITKISTSKVVGEAHQRVELVLG